MQLMMHMNSVYYALIAYIYLFSPLSYERRQPWQSVEFIHWRMETSEVNVGVKSQERLD